MKSLSMLLWTVLAVGIKAMPQYGQPQAHSVQVRPPPAPPVRAPAPERDLPQGCRYEYKLVQSIVEVETEKQVCNPYKERVCDTKYRQACNPYQEQQCRTVYKEECKTRYVRKCETKYRNVPEQYEEDECKKTYKKVCEATWVVDEYGDKVWKEDRNNCQELPEDECRRVKKTRTKEVKYDDCKNEPLVECDKVPKQECEYVTRTKCERQAYDDCRHVTRQNCEIVHSKVPQTLNGRKRIRVCDHDDIGSQQQPDFDYADQVDIINAVRQANIDEEVEEEEKQEEETNKENIDSGLVFSD